MSEEKEVVTAEEIENKADAIMGTIMHNDSDPVVSTKKLLESGVHFGHQTRKWNPKMSKYIFGSKNGVHILDLTLTAAKLQEAYLALKKIVADGGKVLFVGTKPQVREVIQEEALRSGSFFVVNRWLGGTLTNFKTIKSRIRRMEEIEKMETDGTFDLLPKKEVAGLKKEYEKLNKNLRGIRDMKKVPDALIIVDPRKEEIAIKEARILGIPVFGIVDTNCDPDMVDYVIPGNDDAVRAVKLVIGALTNAIAVANGNEVIDYTTEEDKAKDAKRKERTAEKASKVEKKEETKEEVKEEKKETVDYDKMTVAELKEIAKEKGISVTGLKKAEIIEKLAA